MAAARTLLVAGALVGALLCVGVIVAGDLRVGLRWVRRRTAMALRPETVRVALAQAGLDSIPTEAWMILLLRVTIAVSCGCQNDTWRILGGGNTASIAL